MVHLRSMTRGSRTGVARTPVTRVLPKPRKGGSASRVFGPGGDTSSLLRMVVYFGTIRQACLVGQSRAARLCGSSGRRIRSRPFGSSVGDDDGRSCPGLASSRLVALFRPASSYWEGFR